MAIMNEDESNDWLLNYRSKRAEERRQWQERQDRINAELRHERALIKRNQFRLVVNTNVTIYNPPAWGKRRRKL